VELTADLRCFDDTGLGDVQVWAAFTTSAPRYITAWREWHTAGEHWNTVHRLPAEHWHTLLSPALRHVVTAEGREYVRAGLGAPWQVWRLTRQA